jgi:Pentapeptide repeats (9 copies)
VFKWFKSMSRRSQEAEQIPDNQPLGDVGIKPTGHIGSRRQICFWEPIYSPEHVVALDAYDWDFDRDAGPSRRFVSGPSLNDKIVRGDTFKVFDVTFKDCDFQGHFKPNTLLLFDNCTFSGCDFAHSDWKDAHFRDCKFIDSSISLAAFEGCEFRDCTWSRIGFGSKTTFHRCFVNNPSELISASVSLRNPKDPTLEHRVYQWFRLLGTRAHVLRALMISHQVTGDEHTYYEIVKLHQLQCPKARAGEYIYNIFFSNGKRLSGALGLLSSSGDYLILRSLGFLNNWGVSASRPFIALAMCWGGFGLLYQQLDFTVPVPHPFQKSFDITFLVGYGNQVSADPSLQLFQSAHALIAIVIYTVFFATLVSKLSRSR